MVLANEMITSKPIDEMGDIIYINIMVHFDSLPLEWEIIQIAILGSVIWKHVTFV